MKKIVLVTGYYAAGKSTFARKLSQVLNIPYFTKDTLKEIMANGFGADIDLFDKKGSRTVISIMLHIAECILQSDKVCILESNFHLSQSEQIKTLLDKYNASCLTFLFTGNVDVLWERYEQREPERHWAHRVDNYNKDLFIKGLIEMGVGEVAVGQTIKIDSTDFSKINYEELFAIGNRFVSNCTE